MLDEQPAKAILHRAVAAVEHEHVRRPEAVPCDRRADVRGGLRHLVYQPRRRAKRPKVAPRTPAMRVAENDGFHGGSAKQLRGQPAVGDALDVDSLGVDMRVRRVREGIR